MAGADFEVIVGSIGFFGMVAMLPLFLYLVFVDVRTKEERIEDIPDGVGKQEKLVEQVEPREAEKMDAIPPGRIEREQEPRKEEIDKTFLERLREEQVKRREGWTKESEENALSKDAEKEEKTEDSSKGHDDEEKSTEGN